MDDIENWLEEMRQKILQDDATLDELADVVEILRERRTTATKPKNPAKIIDIGEL